MKMIVIVLVTAFLALSCGVTDNEDDVNEEDFSGITERDVNGAPGKLFDSTDWLPGSCGSEGNCILDGLAAYPNPCINEVFFQYTILKPGLIRIVLNDKPGKELLVLEYKYLAAGTYVYRLDIWQNNLKPGIYRIYIELEPAGGNIIKSFGDIQVKI